MSFFMVRMDKPIRFGMAELRSQKIDNFLNENRLFTTMKRLWKTLLFTLER